MTFQTQPGIGQNGSDDACSDPQPTQPSTLLDMIDDYLGAIETGDEISPAEVGAMERWPRHRTIQAALALAAAKASRSTVRKRPHSVGVLYYVAIHSDNKFGRCTHGAQRIAEYLGCSDRTVRDTIMELAEGGSLRIEIKAGSAPLVWLPYAQLVKDASNYDILTALAPEGRTAGRPSQTPGKAFPGFSNGNRKTPEAIFPEFSDHDRKTLEAMFPGLSDEGWKTLEATFPGFSKKTLEAMFPGISSGQEKPRKRSEKTPETVGENPGNVASDTKNSSLNNSSDQHLGHAQTRATHRQFDEGDDLVVGGISTGSQEFRDAVTEMVNDWTTIFTPTKQHEPTADQLTGDGDFLGAISQTEVVHLARALVVGLPHDETGIVMMMLGGRKGLDSELLPRHSRLASELVVNLTNATVRDVRDAIQFAQLEVQTIGVQLECLLEIFKPMPLTGIVASSERLQRIAANSAAAEKARAEADDPLSDCPF